MSKLVILDQKYVLESKCKAFNTVVLSRSNSSSVGFNWSKKLFWITYLVTVYDIFIASKQYTFRIKRKIYSLKIISDIKIIIVPNLISNSKDKRRHL